MASVTPKSTVQVVVEQLKRTPEDLATAEPKLPKLGGFYAWWARRGCIANVPGNPHPTEAEFDLFYVGIAPVSAASSSTIRSRVRNNHMRGNIASSTFRFTLASLLVDALKLRPIAKASKIVLEKDQNDQLSQWQRENLRLTWHAVSEPRTLEVAVIADLRPPLNLADNHDHPFTRPWRKHALVFENVPNPRAVRRHRRFGQDPSRHRVGRDSLPRSRGGVASTSQ
jgi:hypothetical protein